MEKLGHRILENIRSILSAITPFDMFGKQKISVIILPAAECSCLKDLMSDHENL
jgi:hypothetical protein